MKRLTRYLLILVAVTLNLTAFQNCGVGFQTPVSEVTSSSTVDPSSSYQQLKDAAIDAEWAKVRQSFADYTQNQVTPAYMYPLYDVQLSTAPFLQYAISRGNEKWLRDLRELYKLGYSHLTTVNSYVFNYPVDFSGGGFVAPYEAEKPLDRSFKMWVTTPASGSGFSVGGESVLVSSQYLYPISVLIWDAARKGKLDEPDVADFTAKYWDVMVKDHLLRWIFNEGTVGTVGTSKTVGGVVNAPGYGVFQLAGWGCNEGDFNHAERVEHLMSRRFGTAYFAPLYGVRALGPAYCNSLWDTDLWILEITAQALAAHNLNPTRLPMSDADYTRLSQHLANGLAMIASRVVYKNITNSVGKIVEAAIVDPGGFDGHPDNAYTADLDPSYPGYTVTGGPVARAPHAVTGVGWDISHGRRLVQFLWTVQTLQTALNLNFPTARMLQGTGQQLAYGVFNQDFAHPAFANFMDGTNGWYRVNYSDRPGMGYAPSSWDLGRSFLTGGYGLWQNEVPDLVNVLLSSAKREDFAPQWAKIEIYPSMPPVYFRK